MAYDEYLADRIRAVLESRKISFEEMKMMGGLCYMVDDKMCVGVVTTILCLDFNPKAKSSKKKK